MPVSPTLCLIARSLVCTLGLAGAALPGRAQLADRGAQAPVPAASEVTSSQARPAYAQPLNLGQLRQIQQVGRAVLGAHGSENQDAADHKQLDGLRKALDELLSAETASAHPVDARAMPAAQTRLSQARQAARGWAARLEQRAEEEESLTAKTSSSARTDTEQGLASVKGTRARLFRKWSAELTQLSSEATAEASLDTSASAHAGRTAAQAAQGDNTGRLLRIEELRHDLMVSRREWPDHARPANPTLHMQVMPPENAATKKKGSKT